MSGAVTGVVLGFWLFVSAFLWPHSAPQLYNAWITGAVAASVAVAATRWPSARYVNAALGVWLFVSAFFLPRVSDATGWNHVGVGLLLMIVSLASELPARRPSVTVRTPR